MSACIYTHYTYTQRFSLRSENAGIFSSREKGAMLPQYKDLQFSILRIIDGNGTAVVEYIYDAWGKALERPGAWREHSVQFNLSDIGGMCTTKRRGCITAGVGSMPPSS